MFKYVIFLLIAIFPVQCIAQTADDEARIIYQEALDYYDQQKYGKCMEVLEKLRDRMGGWNPKTAYLDVRAAHESWKTHVTKERDPEVENQMEQNLRFVKMFFGMIDKADYPPEKYDDMVRAKLFFEQLLKENEYPVLNGINDALVFLNEMSAKFPRKTYIEYLSPKNDKPGTTSNIVARPKGGYIYQTTAEGTGIADVMLHDSLLNVTYKQLFYLNATKLVIERSLQGYKPGDTTHYSYRTLLCLNLSDCKLKLVKKKYHEAGETWFFEGNTVPNAYGGKDYDFITINNEKMGSSKPFTPQDFLTKLQCSENKLSEINDNSGNTNEITEDLNLNLLFTAFDTRFKQTYEKRVVKAINFLINSYKPAECQPTPGSESREEVIQIDLNNME